MMREASLRLLADGRQRVVHRTGDQTRRDKDERARDVRVERPVNAVATLDANLTEEVPWHGDGPRLLHRVRPVEHVDFRVHGLSLEISYGC